MSDAMPGESGSVAEALGSVAASEHSTSGGPTDGASNQMLAAAFHFTGTSASANGATMQEYFFQSAISSIQHHDLLITRLRGLSHEWSTFCDQEISLRLPGDDAVVTNDQGVVNPTRAATSATQTLSTAVHTSSNPSVNVRIRRSLLPANQFPGRSLATLRYLGVVETDKLVSRRSCLEVPVAGPVVYFLQELGFEPEYTFVAEGYIFIRGRTKACVYTLNEVTQFEGPSVGLDGGALQESLPKEWRRICPRSWLVEISAVGCPADESLQEEVSDFADLLHPLVIPSKMDHAPPSTRK